MFRDKATSVLAGFHVGPPSWSNWNLEMLALFVTEETGETIQKLSEQGENQTRNSTGM